jgi:tyrosyl-tRNA synthetase
VSEAFRPTSDFLAVLSERGFLHQCSDLAGLDEKAKSGDLVAYIGFDCTAASLHVGSLVQIMMLRWLQKTGGKPIALMGGGTTRVGDPSGKDESRKLLTEETIEANKAGIKQVFAKFLTFGAEKHDAIMADNADWLLGLNYVNFLRDVGRHFSVNRMLAMDSVKLRLEREHELSFLEFNYMCLQAYDFVELNRRHNVTLQMGGSDQWGNIITGIDLGRRLGTPQLYALTSPLLATASGAKMGNGTRRRVARCEHAFDLRLLAILAQLRGRGRRALPEAVHRIAARRNCAACRVARRRHQRSEENSRDGSDGDGAWARGGGTGR